MKIWNDECGAVLSAELVLLMTITGIAMTIGLKAIQSSVLNEMNDVANAIGAINQSYSYAGVQSCEGVVAGSWVVDSADDCDSTQLTGMNSIPATEEGLF